VTLTPQLWERYGAAVTLGSWDYCSGMWAGRFAAFPATANWPAANQAVWYPMSVNRPFLAKWLWWLNGTVVGTVHVDVGIYLPNGSRLVSTGSTVQAGSTAIQGADVTDTLLMPGIYYMGFAMDANTSGMLRYNMVLSTARGMGFKQQAAAFVLPNPATFAAPSGTHFMPVFGASDRTVV